MQYEGKTVVVTAAGSGMGREIVLRFAAGGAHVYATDIDASAADETLSLVKKRGGSGASMKCDVGSDDDVALLVDRVLTERGGVDFLFNHAGIPLAGVLEKITSEDWLWMLNINVVGMARAISGFLPSMMDRKSGYIINTSSGMGLFPIIPVGVPYATSKAGIVGMSRALQLYVRPHGINVSVFCPDITFTKFHWSGRWVGITKEQIDASLPLDMQQPVDKTIDYLLQCLQKRKFLVSLVPNTREMLTKDAEMEFEPDISGAS